MKKKLSVMTVIILALAICVSAWFYGYYTPQHYDYDVGVKSPRL